MGDRQVKKDKDLLIIIYHLIGKWGGEGREKIIDLLNKYNNILNKIKPTYNEIRIYILYSMKCWKVCILYQYNHKI